MILLCTNLYVVMTVSSDVDMKFFYTFTENTSQNVIETTAEGRESIVDLLFKKRVCVYLFTTSLFDHCSHF